MESSNLPLELIAEVVNLAAPLTDSNRNQILVILCSINSSWRSVAHPLLYNHVTCNSLRSLVEVVAESKAIRFNNTTKLGISLPVLKKRSGYTVDDHLKKLLKNMINVNHLYLNNLGSVDLGSCGTFKQRVVFVKLVGTALTYSVGSRYQAFKSLRNLISDKVPDFRQTYIKTALPVLRNVQLTGLLVQLTTEFLTYIGSQIFCLHLAPSPRYITDFLPSNWSLLKSLKVLELNQSFFDQQMLASQHRFHIAELLAINLFHIPSKLRSLTLPYVDSTMLDQLAIFQLDTPSISELNTFTCQYPRKFIEEEVLIEEPTESDDNGDLILTKKIRREVEPEVPNEFMDKLRESTEWNVIGKLDEMVEGVLLESTSFWQSVRDFEAGKFN